MIQLEVWGDYALFSRPELKVERMSYDVPTPSAARGLVEAIYSSGSVLAHRPCLRTGTYPLCFGSPQ